MKKRISLTILADLIIAIGVLSFIYSKQSDFRLASLIGICAAIAMIFIWLLYPASKQRTNYMLLHLGVWTVVFVCVFIERNSYRKEQLVTYGVEGRAAVVDVFKQRKRYGYNWKAKIFYIAKGKSYTQSIPNKHKLITENDTVLILYSKTDPDLYEVKKVLKYKPAQAVESPLAESRKQDLFNSPPQYSGGMGAFYQYLKENIEYPEAAKRNRTMGKVHLSFVIEKDGSINEVTVVKGIGDGCDEAAVQVIKGSPKWIPAIMDGKPVKVKYNLPISFYL